MATTGGRDQQAHQEDIEIWLIIRWHRECGQAAVEGNVLMRSRRRGVHGQKSPLLHHGGPPTTGSNSPSTRTGRPAVDSRMYRSMYLAAKPKRPHDQADAQLERLTLQTPGTRSCVAASGR